VIIKLTAESKLMPVHIDSAAAKGDAFHLQPEPLLEPVLARYADNASSAQHAVPGQSVERVQRPNYLPRGSRKSGGGGDLSIGGDLSSRDLSDGVGNNG
jgi:hypothetical protein